jgi:hypothetical protein
MKNMQFNLLGPIALVIKMRIGGLDKGNLLKIGREKRCRCPNNRTCECGVARMEEYHNLNQKRSKKCIGGKGQRQPSDIKCDDHYPVTGCRNYDNK